METQDLDLPGLDAQLETRNSPLSLRRPGSNGVEEATHRECAVAPVLHSGCLL